MTIDEAVSIVDKRSWEQTKALLGPLPEVGQADAWFDQRDRFWNEIWQELKDSGIIAPDQALQERLDDL